jgi:hypothetical protein
MSRVHGTEASLQYCANQPNYLWLKPVHRAQDPAGRPLLPCTRTPTYCCSPNLTLGGLRGYSTLSYTTRINWERKILVTGD